MPCNNSSLDALAAFAVCFVSGVLSAVSFIKYIDKVRRDTITTTMRRD